MKKPILASLFPVALLAFAAAVHPANAAVESFNFTVNQTIPDGALPLGLTDTRTPASTINAIQGITLTLDIRSIAPLDGWTGDLYAFVQHVTPGGTGFSVLLNRVGTTAGDRFGYSDSGLSVTFSDAATNDIHLYQTDLAAYTAALNPVTGVVSGTWQPDGRNVEPNTTLLGSVTDASSRTAMLTSGTNPFTGLSAKGSWTVFLSDGSGGGAMTLNSWTLDISGISGPFYWKGQTNGSWSTIGDHISNWAADAAGTVPLYALPLSTDDVIFSANGAANQSTTLDQSFTIHSLTIADPVAVTINSGIGGPNTLTISGNAGTGLDVQASAGLVTIGANLTLAGASDTITVNNAAGAVINGALGGSNGLNKLGTGTLTLAGTNTYTGNTTIDGGKLKITGSVGNGTSTSDFVVGNNNAGSSLEISGGGVLTNGKTTIGNNAGSNNNTVLLDGAGSQWNTSATFYLGWNGSGNTMTVSNGAQFKLSNGAGNIDAVIGANGGSNNNKLTITGTGSLFSNVNATNTSTLYVGRSGTGNEMDISAGGQVDSFNARIGGDSGTNGLTSGNLVKVDGTGSIWNIGGTLRVGGSGTNSNSSLTISNGGVVNVTTVNKNTFVGFSATSTGNNVLVKDAGSQLNVFALTVGNGGSGTVTVADGGTLTSTSPAITLGALAGSSGTLQIGNGAGAGTVNAASITTGLGTGTVIFNHTDAPYTFAPLISGTTSVQHNGSGTTLLTALNTYTGTTTISAGTLSIGVIANGGTASGIGQSTSAATNLVLDGGALQYTGATFTSDRAFKINNGKIGTVDIALAGTTLTLPGATGAATTGTLNKIGLGSLNLAGVNTYTGGTNVNAGTLSIDNDGATTFGVLGSGTTTVNGGTIPGAAGGTLKFLKLADATGGTFIVNGGAALGTGGGTLSFHDTATTGNGIFSINGPTLAGEPQGMLFFFNSATAATGNFTVNGGTLGAGTGGYAEIDTTATLASSVWNVKGGSAVNAFGGTMSLFATTTAANANITVSGGTAAGATGGNVNFAGNSTAGSATITIDGGTAAGATGGLLAFGGSSQAGSSTLNANGGSGGGAGGTILFTGTSTGGTASITLSGNSQLDISGTLPPGVAIGSLAGAGGTVSLGARNLTIGTNNTNTTFGGLIQDGGGWGGTGGSLTKVGTGTLRLDMAADNTYTGGTFVNQGVLEVVGHAPTLNALGSGPVTIGTGLGAPGSATLRDGLSVTFDNLSDTARVTVNSDGVFDISTASFERVGSIAGSGQAVLGGNSLIAGRDNTSSTFSGTISGIGGRVTKEGTGTMTLTGINTYTGGTTLSAGTLAAGSTKAFGSGNLTLTGGTLRTTGPLSVDIGAGNILFGGGTYRAIVGGTAAGVNHDQLKTTGIANIGGGTLALVQQGGFLLVPGDKVNLLIASGGVAGGSATGTPVPGSNVTGLSAFSNSPLIVPVVNIYTDRVVLEAMQGSFRALAGVLGFTPNQIAVAGALDNLAALNGNRTGVIPELNFLDTQPVGELLSNLNKISPDSLTAIFANAVALANLQSSNLGNHMSDIRSGASTPSASGMAAAGSGPSFTGTFAGPKGKSSKEVAAAEEERWGMFLTGSGEFTRVGSTTNAAGFHLETGGVTGGIDYRVNEHLAIGIDFGYVGTTASLLNGGSIETDGGRLGIYGTYFINNFHVDAAVNGGLNSYKTKRVTPNNTAATGSPNGSEVNILLSTGYDWKLGKLTIGPTASYQYTNVRLDSFTEAGAFLPLAVAGQTSESSRTGLGFHVSYDTHVGRYLVRPEARLSWQHEFGATTSSITSRFANVGGAPFTVSGPKIGRDSLVVGAGVSVQWSPRCASYLYYDGEVGRTNYNSNSVSGGFRFQF